MDSSHAPKPVDETVLRLFVDDPLALEERDDLPELVPSLPAQTFVQLARRLRDEARLDLLIPHASGDQLARLLDLEVWRRDRIETPLARTWLYLIVEAFSASGRARGDLIELMHAMDPEMWTFALCQGTRVIELDPERDDARDLAAAELEGAFPWETPDGAFMIGVPDDELGRCTIRVLQRVYADSLGDGRALVLSMLGALPSTIEEDLLRWRSGRLADLGFVEWEEAARLFRPLDRDAAATAGRIGRPPDAQAVPPLHLERQGDRDLLGRVLARLDPGEQGTRAREFMLLVNTVMAAQRFEPGDAALQERAVHQTRATLGLGLELLLGAAPDRDDPDGFLADRLTALGLRDLFRVGYGALDRLRRAALALHRGGRISLSRVGSMLDRPFGPAIGALSALYPELPRTAATAGTRPIASLRDVALATELVAQAAALAALTFHPAGYAAEPAWIGRADEPERIVLGDLVRTAAILGARARDAAFAPLAPEDVQWAADHLVVDRRISVELRADFVARCGAVGVAAHAEVLADAVLGRLLAELTSLEHTADGAVDLTRTGGLLTIQQLSMWLRLRGGDA